MLERTVQVEHMRFLTLLAICLVRALVLPLPAVASEAALLYDGAPFHDYVCQTQKRIADQAPREHGNYVGILNHGYEALLLRVYLIRNAKKSIDIQTFIWADDECGNFFRHELEKAALRGVKVRVIADYISSAKNPQLLAMHYSASPNIQIKSYRPAARQLRANALQRLIDVLLPTGTHQRMHNKTMIFDGVIGLTGGRNFDNHYYNYATTFNFKDRDAWVIGPVVQDMAASFEEYWKFRKAVDLGKLRDVRRYIKKNEEEPLKLPREDNAPLSFWEQLEEDLNTPELLKAKFHKPLLCAEKVRFLADKPGVKTAFFYLNPWGGGRVSKEIRATLRRAKDTMFIQSPYVIVNMQTRSLFRKLLKLHPDMRIRISTNSFGAADHIETYSANFRLRSKIIDGLGLEVYEYKPHPADQSYHLPNYEELVQRAEDEGLRRSPFMSIHAKTFVLDERIAFVGTYNLDPRSQYINSEDGFLIEDSRIAQAIQEDILRDIHPDNSWIIARKQIPLADVNRLLTGISGLSPIEIWPLQNTSSFELLPEAEAVPPGHPDFYQNYKDIGSFPGAEGLTPDEIITRLYSMFGKVVTPLL